jgi:hypothetical protein
MKYSGKVTQETLLITYRRYERWLVALWIADSTIENEAINNYRKIKSCIMNECNT